MGWQKKAKEFFNFHHGVPTTRDVFYLLTITILTLLLPLSFLLLASLSGAQYYLQTLISFQYSQQQPFPFPFLFTLALNINPCILYLLVSIVSVATLIHSLMGKITLLSESPSSSVLQPRLYIAWILLCTFQVCVGLGIEGSIAAGVYDSDDESSSFGAERSLLSRVFFLLGLHETTQVWSRVVVRPVVDDTVFGGARKERWIERVAMAMSLGTLWWWRLREEVETLVVVTEGKKEQLMEVGMVDFVGWWLYYLTVTIGMVRIVKGLIWMLMICVCRRRVTGISPVESSHDDDQNDDKKQHGEPPTDAAGTLSVKINQLKKQIQAERIVSIKEKLQRNEKKLQCHISEVMSAISSRDSSQTEENRKSSILSSRIDHPLCKFNGFSQVSGDRDHNNQDELSATSIKIPYMERLPPYTSWIFLDRNQRMAEDQSVVGRRRIYYDQHGSEALICSDSEEEITEPEEEKHEFSEAEDRILWMAFEEHGLNEEVLNIVSKSVGGTNLEIQERYKSIKENNIGRFDQHSEGSGEYESPVGICPEKSLSAALDSFDNLFCRRCLIFDCRLHGCSQPLIYPREKQTVWSEPEGDRKPCSDQCYLQEKCVNTDCHSISQQLKAVKSLTEDSTPGSYQDKKTTIIEEADGILAPSSAEEPDNQSTALPTEVDCHGYLNLNAPVSENLGKRKVTDQSDTELCDSILPPDDPQNSCKKLKRVSDDVVSSSTCHGEHDKSVGDGPQDVTNETEIKKLSNSMEGQVDAMLSLSDWKPLEKELYLKGVEMFGRNSCLIARNLLSGLKTCVEIASYMHAGGVSMPHRSLVAPSSIMDDRGKFDGECTDQDMPSRSRLLRKRGKTRKFKYSWKSAGHPSIWKRIADGKNQSCKQYTPCGCQSMCGKDCSCVNGGTCCEKYCGCSKSCKNRFRGCHCAKSQCRSRQCPCFAAGRECDPDVCRNCWVSCGDGSLGEPPRHGEGQCGNMRLLLRQQQRILLAKSDVAGWGAFLKNPVNKNDYLGEYTGELISHREADKRGKIYDRANSSFLFDLNDQYVLDAYRKGDKLKFANHSSNPNCYAKVMLVAGDHRVGIFAKEHIDASEELFYDYRYGPDQAPPWARKPEGSKRDESAVPQGRAKKHQSH